MRRRKKVSVIQTLFSILILGIIISATLDFNDPEKQAAMEASIAKSNIGMDEWVQAHRVESYARAAIAEYLKLPEEAEFDNTPVRDCMVYLGDDSYVVEGWVKFRNNAGKIIRMRYTIQIKEERHGIWSVLETPIITTE